MERPSIPPPERKIHSKSTNAEQDILPPGMEEQYWQERPMIKNTYRKVHAWHGTGLFGHGGGTNMLGAILKRKAIMPHLDFWDREDRATTSLTIMRPYAASYADPHQHEGNDLQFRDARSGNFGKYVVKKTIGQPVSLASAIRHIPRLRKTRTHVKQWLENKAGKELTPEERKHFARRFGSMRSAVPGNYSILIGVAEGAYTPVDTAAYLKPTEERTDQPIGIEYITHLEVPSANMQETQALVDQYGVSLPIIPRELGERFSSEFSDYELLTGKGFKEESYPIPDVTIPRSLLEQFVPQREWFTSPQRAESFYGGVDHHLRVLILQEVLTNFLISSGQLKGDQMDREALRWAAMAHDIRRHSGFDNRSHAQESANWILQMLPQDMSTERKRKIFAIVKGHSGDIPKDPSIAIETAILMDADALDRIRLQKSMPSLTTPEKVRRKVGLDPDRLHFPISHALLPMANDLYRISVYDEAKRVNGPENAVFDAATRLGLVA